MIDGKQQRRKHEWVDRKKEMIDNQKETRKDGQTEGTLKTKDGLIQ